MGICGKDLIFPQETNYIKVFLSFFFFVYDSRSRMLHIEVVEGGNLKKKRKKI